MLHNNISVENNTLYFAGVSTVEMAKKYGTPLMLLDEKLIRNNLSIYTNTMNEVFPTGSKMVYASKALSFTEMYRIVESEKVATDIVSTGELWTAKNAGFSLENAFFHGNNKLDKDIELAMDLGVGYFVVDTENELDAIERIAKTKGIFQKILLRLTPGIDPHTHVAISTGKVDSKFGTAIETGQAFDITRKALILKNVELKGFHCHIGSQIFEVKPYLDAADIMLSFIKKINDAFGFVPDYLNLGGGFGVRYVENHPQIDISHNLKLIATHMNETCTKLGIKLPAILMEPGRSIVAAAGLTLYTVGSIKEIKGYKNYVSIDGGMTDNPRYALYQSEYTVMLANRAEETANFVATIAGRCCESGDLIQENVLLPKPERGDYLAVLVTGAYNYSMASNYNRVSRPPIVIINNTDRIAVKRESFEDIVRLDV